jgi:hypothetical protein
MSGQSPKIRFNDYPREVSSLTVQEAIEESQAEILAFLSERPMHTFGLVGMIQMNGVISPLNRGAFYTCRNEFGTLEGVALIGHNNLFEARSEEVVAAFANHFRSNPNPFLLMGEEAKIDSLVAYFGPPESLDAESHRYILYGQTWPVQVHEPVHNLRLATFDDLDLVVRAHAQDGIEQNGIDGFQQDPEGFTERCANRIEKQKTWVWIEDNKLIFKIETVTSTAAVAYLESMWVDPGERRKGYGLRCITQLGRNLLQHSASICLLVKETQVSAHALYKRAGYKNLGTYRVLFFHQS